jgi:predicted nucleic acid-binding protein
MSFLQVLAVGPAELRAAADLLRRYSDQRLTLMDAVGLHVMKAHGVGTCWSTDHHLGLTGVQLAMHHQ